MPTITSFPTACIMHASKNHFVFDGDCFGVGPPGDGEGVSDNQMILDTCAGIENHAFALASERDRYAAARM